MESTRSLMAASAGCASVALGEPAKLRLCLAISAAVVLCALSASEAQAVVSRGVTGGGGGGASASEIGCGAETTKALVGKFVGDYNAGRVAAAERAWSPAPRFQWFSTIRPGARLGARAKNRTSLAGYFRTRAQVHEQIRLTKLGAGYDAKRNIVHFGGRLVRSADDLWPALRDFKGAADCEPGRPYLIVWSM